MKRKKKTELPTVEPAPVEPEVVDGEADLPLGELTPKGEIPALDQEAAALPAAQDSSTGLVPYDALSAYLREIGRYHQLSKEEEQAAALRYYHSKDRKAAFKLISGNLLLVVKIAREYERAARSLLDLIQEGNLGLMEAVRAFDPYRGVRFPSYAIWWIKAYIIRYVIANWRLVKIGTTQAQRKLFFNLMKEKDKLEREGFYPGPRLLAERLDVKESEVVEMEQRLSSQDLSVDAPLGPESDATILSVLPAETMTAEDLLTRRQMREALSNGLQEFSSTLNRKELVIFRRRLLSEEKATLQELAVELSLSRERIRQLENRIKERMRQFFKGKFDSGIDSSDFEP